jgi:hypothetical protein
MRQREQKERGGWNEIHGIDDHYYPVGHEYREINTIEQQTTCLPNSQPGDNLCAYR